MKEQSNFVSDAAFDAFWLSTMDANPPHLHEVSYKEIDEGLQSIRVFDVDFKGYAGSAVKGWFLLPAKQAALFPLVIEFLPYGYGRGDVLSSLALAASGFAHFIMDVRGQGSEWRSGDTYDEGSTGPSIPGFMTRGLEDPVSHYFRRLYVDAFRAVAAAAAHPEISPTQIYVYGRSQGGALALAAAATSSLVRAAFIQAPFLADFSRSIFQAQSGPYLEVLEWCRMHPNNADNAFETLSYFDAARFAARCEIPGFYSIGLLDGVAPIESVETVIAAHLGEAHVRRWKFNGHEVGGLADQRGMIAAIRAIPLEGAGGAAEIWFD